MTLAESTMVNTIKWGLTKSCCSNLIVAGPICSGKSSLVGSTKQWFETLGYPVNIFDQNDYYKDGTDIEVTPYGLNIDSAQSFEYEKFKRSVENMFKNGFSYSPFYNKRQWTKKITLFEENEEIPLDKTERFKFHKNEIVNIFTGLHAITFLKDIVPNASLFYVNTNLEICFLRRINTPHYQKIITPKVNMESYKKFVFEQIEECVSQQLNEADVVVKYE